MKKILTTILSVLFIATIGVAIAACSDATMGNNQSTNSTPAVENNDGNEYLKADNYLSNMKTKQRKVTVKDNHGKDKIEYAELINSTVIEDIMFLEYNIGRIENCFIEAITQPQYQDGAFIEYNRTESNWTAQTVSVGIGNAISKTDSKSTTTSKTEENSKKITWGFGIGASLGKNVKLVDKLSENSTSGGLTGNLNHSVDKYWSEEETTSETIANSTTTSSNEEYTLDMTTEESVTDFYRYDFTKYQPGYFYALCLVADIEVYQVIAYNIGTGELVSSYFVSVLDGNKVSRKVLASETAAFTVMPDYQLSPITEVTVDLADSKDIGKVVEVNMEDCYTYESASLDGFSHANFNPDTGVFMAHGADGRRVVKKYIFNGASCGATDINGQKVRTQLDGFSVCVTSEHDIELCFVNMDFISVDGKPAVYLNERTENKTQTITISSSGYGANIYGKNGNTADGCSAIEIPNLVLAGTGIKFSITGGNGTAATQNGANGYNGGVGIIADTLTVDTTSELIIIGGNGGDGGNGSDGYGYGYQGDREATYHGNDGGDGGDGGDGSCAISTKYFELKKNATAKLQSGNGGNGGVGGDGGDGSSTGEWGYQGGNGGNGGNGGDGGNCYSAYYVETKETISGNISFVIGQAGIGGAGGDRGSAGCGEKAWYDRVNSESANDWYGSNGAYGNKGADGVVLNYVIALLTRECTDIIAIGDTSYSGAYSKDINGVAITDKIDLASYKDRFTADYKFTFVITLTISEKDDGYQEVHLYNKNTLFSEEDVVSQEILNANGYITGNPNIAHGSGVDTNIYSHEVTLQATGDKLADIIYLRYDANGTDNDTWYLHDVSVKVYYQNI